MCNVEKGERGGWNGTKKGVGFGRLALGVGWAVKIATFFWLLSTVRRERRGLSKTLEGGEGRRREKECQWERLPSSSSSFREEIPERAKKFCYKSFAKALNGSHLE